MRKPAVLFTVPAPPRLIRWRLFLGAITDRLGLTDSRCPYCCVLTPGRWPWQAVSPHVTAAHPLRP